MTFTISFFCTLAFLSHIRKSVYSSYIVYLCWCINGRGMNILKFDFYSAWKALPSHILFHPTSQWWCHTILQNMNRSSFTILRKRIKTHEMKNRTKNVSRLFERNPVYCVVTFVITVCIHSNSIFFALKFLLIYTTMDSSWFLVNNWKNQFLHV